MNTFKRLAAVALLMGIAVAVCAATSTTVTLTPDQVQAICNSQGGCGGGGGGSGGGGLVCTPPQVLNSTGTACVTPPIPVASCGVSGTVSSQTMSWANPTRLYQSMGPDDAYTIQFTTGSTSSTYSLPRITAAEFNSSPSSRVATLSSKPCDFSAQPAPGAQTESNSVTMVFALGTGNGYGYYPVLALNTTYYLNVKNSPNSTCRSSGACDMFIDLLKPGGLTASRVDDKLNAALQAHASKAMAACGSRPPAQRTACFARFNGQLDAVIKAATR